MHDGSESERGTSVLVIAQLDADERGLVESLGARGMKVRACATALDGMRAAREGVDVVVLGLPIPDADPLAVCAALKEAPYPPDVVLADSSDQALALAESLPETCRPDAIVPRPLDAAKLAMAIHECQQGDSDVERPAAVSLAELLVELKRRRSSEVLEIRAAGVCTAIYLRDGDPIFAEGGSLQETLGRQLVRRGAIGHEDYARVVARLTEGVIQHESLRLGEVLVELELLTPAEVYDALSFQVQDKIIACFQWEQFAYELHEILDDAHDLGIYQCPPIEALVLSGMREHYGPDRLKGMLDEHAGSVPVLRQGVEALVPRFHLTTAEQKLLRAIDGARTVDQLRNAGILDPVHAGQVLAALTAACQLSLRKKPLDARARETVRPSPPERRSKPPAPQPQPAAKPLAAAPAAKTGVPIGRIPLLSTRERTFDPLVQLRRRMGLAPSPGAGSPKHARLEAENAFNAGLRLLRESALPGALREFRRAVELVPAEPEYRLLEAWLEYRTTPDGEAKRLAAAKVRACAERVLESSRTSARAHSVLGQLALAEGDDETAERLVRLALRYEYGDVEAQRALRILEKRKRS
jgi:DNA-binding NarL/FixJ family response regulator